MVMPKCGSIIPTATWLFSETPGNSVCSEKFFDSSSIFIFSIKCASSATVGKILAWKSFISIFYEVKPQQVDVFHYIHAVSQDLITFQKLLVAREIHLHCPVAHLGEKSLPNFDSFSWFRRLWTNKDYFQRRILFVISFSTILFLYAKKSLHNEQLEEHHRNRAPVSRKDLSLGRIHQYLVWRWSIMVNSRKLSVFTIISTTCLRWINLRGLWNLTRRNILENCHFLRGCLD